MGFYGGWAPYVSVAKRREQSAKKIASMRKTGELVSPVVIEGRTIAKTFWGKAWCDHLASYSDYENRLPRGRSYVRNGAVIDLDIQRGEVKALVSGSSIYQVKINIERLEDEKWRDIVFACTGAIESLVELLQGKFSKHVMSLITDPIQGLFPRIKEIKVSCDCPDYATMCKHVSATLYGIGARLDGQPDLLFALRQVDHFELLHSTHQNLDQLKDHQGTIDNAQLSELFGIDIEAGANGPKPKKSRRGPKADARKT